MKTERDVITLVPVCSSVAGMHLHHLEGRRAAQEWSARFEETADPPTPQAVERVYPLHAVADVVAASLCLPRRSQAEAGRGVQLALGFARRTATPAFAVLRRSRQRRIYNTRQHDRANAVEEPKR